MKSFGQYSSSALVQSNSVQLQFAALSRDRDEYRHEMEAAERERRLVETQVQNLKSTQTSLMKDTSSIQEELGGLTRTLSLLCQEQSRLTRVLENERRALENCARHTTSLIQQEIKKKEAYLAEIGPLNEELCTILEQEAAYDFHKLLTVESVQAAVMAKPLPPVSPQGIAVNAEAVSEGFSLLQEAESKADLEIKRYHVCSEKLVELRTCERQNQPPAIETDPVAQEKVWGCEVFDFGSGVTEQEEPPHHDGGSEQRRHMDLFYGSQQD
jgi:hypothetical protein